MTATKSKQFNPSIFWEPASMPSHSICTACLKALRQQLRYARQARTSTPYAYTRSLPVSLLSFSSRSAQRSHNNILNPTRIPKASYATAKNVGQQPESSQNLSTVDKIAIEVRKRATATTEPYVAYGVCDRLIKECARQADYTIPQAQEKEAIIPKTKHGEDLGVGTGWWYEELGLTPTFNTWAQVTFLHMYTLNVRMRCFPSAQATIWHQHLLDHFFYGAEERMTQLHGMSSRAVRNKYLKDLFLQWRGLLAGYDEGIAKKNDAVLATAVWRNIFSADENTDLRMLGIVVSYLRGVLKGLDRMDDEGVMNGEVVFGDPASQRQGVLVRSRLMERAEREGGQENAE